MNTQRGLFVFAVLLCLGLGGCGPGRAWAAVRTPTVAVSPVLAGLAGQYACMGYERGMIAGFGQFSITKEGQLNDGQKDWPLVETGASDTFAFVDHPQFAALVVDKEKTYQVFTIEMKPGLQVAHADDGYVWCSKGGG